MSGKVGIDCVKKKKTLKPKPKNVELTAIYLKQAISKSKILTLKMQKKVYIYQDNKTNGPKLTATSLVF